MPADDDATTRTAFTWRLSRERADRLDALARAVRNELGWARLSRTELLDTLADYVTDRPELVTELARRIDADQA